MRSQGPWLEATHPHFSEAEKVFSCLGHSNPFILFHIQNSTTLFGSAIHVEHSYHDLLAYMTHISILFPSPPLTSALLMLFLGPLPFCKKYLIY